MKRATLARIVRFLFHALTRTVYEGVENLPATGGLIVATNHLSQLDTPLLMINPGRSEDLTALVTDKYQRFGFMRWFVNTAGGIWIDRTKADFSAFRAAIDAIKAGRAVGIAPEGTRSTSGGLQQGKPGTILLALKSEAPIVPVGIHGTEAGFNKIFTLRRPHFTARFGRPFTLPPVSRENREQAMQDLTDEIMCQIAALLPESYRGYYRDFPRVRELLAEQAGRPAPSRVVV